MNNNTLIAIMRARRRRRRNGNGAGHLLLRLALGGCAMLLLAMILSIGLLVASAAGSAYAAYAYFTRDLPPPEEVGRQTAQAFKTARLYDRTGQTLLFELIDPHGGKRTIVPLDRIPAHLINATVALEDKSFWDNPGFSLEGLARAFWNNLRGLPIQGGSSITVQLIKNVIIPPEERAERSYTRKAKEYILAWELSRRYPGQEGKRQILEWYLNTIYYGNLAYGVEAAAEVYFGKHVQDLTLAEAAMLAALPQYPALNPIDNPDLARRRQEIVLDQMALQGYITPEEAYAAKQEELRPPPPKKLGQIVAPHFVDYVRSVLEERFGADVIYRRGLKVYTTIDLELQKAAEEAARQHVALLSEKGGNVSNAAVVALDPRTAEILVMVGSLDYFNTEIDGQVNVALAMRQPGSAFKPFTYVTAFAQGYTPATMIMDVRSSFPDDPNPPYAPENYDRRYHGPQTLRTALGNSYNIPAVKLLQMVGVEEVIKTAHRMGINTLTRDDYGLSLTLGGGEVRLLDMTYAYGVFANEGVMVGEPVPPARRREGFRELDPVAILRVEDSDGNVLYAYEQPETRRVLSPQLAYLITHILSDNQARISAFGVNNKLVLEGRPAAAKTGTTSDWRDSWTIGYTPQLVTGVWVGNTDNEPMERISGSLGAAFIWHDFMEFALKDEPVMEFVEPPGIEHVQICATSGLLPTPHCPKRRMEIFIEGTAPTAYDNVYQVFRICKPSGKLATVYCPPDQVEERVYEIYPPEADDWVRASGLPQPPREYDDIFGATREAGEVAVLEPAPYSYVRGQVLIQGNARGGAMNFYRLQYGEGLDPAAWIQIGPDHYNQVDHGLLEIWDTSQLHGLYTLQLLAVDHGGGVRNDAIQVTVDNVPPRVDIANPWPDKVYVMEDDEWINFQADASDDVSMDRVEFFMDDSSLGFSTVPPFHIKWNIVMSDITPLHVPDIIRTTGITQEVSVSTQPGGYHIRFPSGLEITADEGGYTETHQIHVVAYDRAGNEAKSNKIKIYIVHKQEEEEEVSGLRSQVSGLRSQVSGLKSQVPGLRSQVSGPRSQVSSPRSQVELATCDPSRTGLRLVTLPGQACDL